MLVLLVSSNKFGATDKTIDNARLPPRRSAYYDGRPILWAPPAGARYNERDPLNTQYKTCDAILLLQSIGYDDDTHLHGIFQTRPPSTVHRQGFSGNKESVTVFPARGDTVQGISFFMFIPPQGTESQYAVFIKNKTQQHFQRQPITTCRTGFIHAYHIKRHYFCLN